MTPSNVSRHLIAGLAALVLLGPLAATLVPTATALPVGTPSAPTGLVATPGNGQVVLSWNAASSLLSVTNYKIYRGTTSGGETFLVQVGNVLTYTNTGLTNGVTYYYKVSAVNVLGEGPQSSEASATPATVPGAPTGLAASPGVGQVTLSWSAPSSNGGSAVTNYRVYRGTSSGGEAFLVQVGNVLTYTDSGLTNGQAYYYKVSAVNAVGEGARSNEASATPSSSAVIVRDDDGTMEANLDFDFVDDTATKDLVLGPNDLTSATAAKLWIYAEGQNCGDPSGTQSIYANNVLVSTYDPCTLWSGASFGWASINVPLSDLVAGVSNHFQVLDSGATWTDRGSFFGIDTGHDYGRSVAIRNYGSDMPGELMWYLEITKGATTIRDDDGTMESNLDFDYGDDTAYKDLILGSSDLTGATSTKLWIYAEGQNCGQTSGTQDLYVNGAYVTTYDPCTLWSGASFGWASINVPLSSLTAGTSNRFQVYDSGATWTDRGSFFGIDTGHDYGRSVAIRNYGSDMPGELMWYLEITK